MANTRQQNNNNNNIADFNELKNFLPLNQRTCEEFYGKWKQPHSEKLYFDNYLEDNPITKKNVTKLCKTEGSKTLIAAPTGAGKTHLMIKTIFPILQEERKKDSICLNLFFVPTRSQSEQIANEYDDIYSIVGDETNYREINTEHGENYSIVYEKAGEVLETISRMKENGEKLDIHLVVDECHTLTIADFRNDAIENIFKLEELVLKEKGSVLHITATPMAMAWNNYNELLFFAKCNTKPSFNNLNLFVNTKTRHTTDFVKDVILPKEKGIIRINNKTSQNKLYEDLTQMGHKTYKVNGDDKSFETDEQGNVIYNNELLNAIINESLIVHSAYTLCTSMLDAGQNIKGIGNLLNKDNQYCGYFCITNILDLDLIAIQQFSNRLRYPVDSYNIIYCNPDIHNQFRNNVSKIFRDIFTLLKNIMYYFRMDMERYQKVAEFEMNILKQTGIYDEESFEKERQHILGFKDVKTNRNNAYGKAITYEDCEYKVHYNFLFKYIYNQYMHQLFFHFDEFVQQIEELFHIQVNVVDNILEFECKSNGNEELKEKLLTLAKNDDFINYYYKQEYADVRNTTLFKNAEFLYRTGLPLQDAIEICCNVSNDFQLNKIKNDNTYKFVKKEFELKDYELLEKILNKEILFDDLKPSDRKDRIGTVLLNDTLIKKVKQMLKIGIPIKTALSVEPHQFSKYIKQYQIIENNKLFLKSETSINVSGSKTQYIILDYIVHRLGFDVGKNNQIVMTEEKLCDIIKLINDQQKTNCTKTQLMNLLKMIFNTWKRVYHKQNTITLVSLKLN